MERKMLQMYCEDVLKYLNQPLAAENPFTVQVPKHRPPPGTSWIYYGSTQGPPHQVPPIMSQFIPDERSNHGTPYNCPPRGLAVNQPMPVHVAFSHGVSKLLGSARAAEDKKANEERVKAAYLKILQNRGCSEAAIVFQALADKSTQVSSKLAQVLRTTTFESDMTKINRELNDAKRDFNRAKEKERKIKKEAKLLKLQHLGHFDNDGIESKKTQITREVNDFKNERKHKNF